MVSEIAGGVASVEPVRLTRNQIPANPFWLIVPGVICVLLSMAEGSPTWAGIVTIAAYLGFSSGFVVGDGLLARIKDQARIGSKSTTSEQVRGMFDLPTILFFWLPQILFMLALMSLARNLAVTPRSLKNTEVLVMLESTSTYFCTIAGTFYKTWRWHRTLPPA